MPELPEVETVRRDLTQFIVGKKITEITIAPDFTKKITPSPKAFISSIVGKKVTQVKRRGKLLLIDLGKDCKVLAHLKMTGQFVWWNPDNTIVPGGHPIDQSCERPDQYNKVLFTFGKSGKLYFNDIRKFGYLKLVNDEDAEKEFGKYGIEPIDPAFTFERFNEILNAKKSLSIKKVLLMQDLIAGIGNIYADESCFAAGVRCSRACQRVTVHQRKLLYDAIKAILAKAIHHRGTSVKNYIDCLGKQGSYAQFLKVYHRVGQPCLDCKTGTIQRTTVGGRGTAYCPVCQK